MSPAYRIEMEAPGEYVVLLHGAAAGWVHRAKKPRRPDPARLWRALTAAGVISHHPSRLSAIKTIMDETI